MQSIVENQKHIVLKVSSHIERQINKLKYMELLVVFWLLGKLKKMTSQETPTSNSRIDVFGGQ